MPTQFSGHLKHSGSLERPFNLLLSKISQKYLKTIQMLTLEEDTSQYQPSWNTRDCIEMIRGLMNAVLSIVGRHTHLELTLVYRILVNLQPVTTDKGLLNAIVYVLLEMALFKINNKQ